MTTVYSNGYRLYVGFNYWVLKPIIMDTKVECTTPTLRHATIVYVDCQ